MPFSPLHRIISGVACVGGALLVAPTAQAQTADSTVLTTAGVYTAAQAAKGKDVHGAACLSCHKPIETTGEKFWNTIVGRPVAEFFGYLRSQMPQDNPGSLSGEDYAAVIAYIFSLNAVPAGETPLPGDSAALAKIKVAPLPPAGSLRTGTRR